MKIIQYLKILCSDTEEYRMVDESYFANLFKSTIYSIPELKDVVFGTISFTPEPEVKSRLEEDSKEENTPQSFLKIMKTESEEESKNQIHESIENNLEEAELYSDLIITLSNFDILGEDPNQELSAQIKKIPRDVYEKISQHINPHHLITKITSKIIKTQKENYRKKLYCKPLI